MNSDSVINYLDEVKTLLTLNEENVFKIRAFDRAIESLTGRDDLEDLAKKGELTTIEGVGKGIAEVLSLYLLKNDTTPRDELKARLPAGLVELTQISGLGPKKARAIIDELGITSVAELEYACRENRLVTLKGFGEKMQTKILAGIEEQKQYSREMLFSDLELLVEKLITKNIYVSGKFARKSETIDSLIFLTTETVVGATFREKAVSLGIRLPVEIIKVSAENLGYEKVKHSSSAEHWNALKNPAPFAAATEEEFYQKLKLPFISSEMRESAESVVLAKKDDLSKIVKNTDIQGVFHMHTNSSDGSATLEQMIERAIKLGYHYIGITDHSEAAFYAHGLTREAIKKQRGEIDKLAKKFPQIKIFHGIESDILQDGSLDYDAKTLKEFDFVIASIHSRFQMNREAMTDRLIRAIENPATTMIGHITGRILLGRKGYEFDEEKVFAAAAKHKVMIEINAHPSRLDVDWRMGPLLKKHEVMVSINPDAHDLAGLEDTRFGVVVARKALLSKSQVFNSRSSSEVESFFAQSASAAGRSA